MEMGFEMTEGPRSVPARVDLRAQDGAMSVFGLFVLLVMLAVMGLAVDTVRAELLRVRAQATLDRAVIAAADRQQDLDPATVVQDHFAAAGLEHMLGEVLVEQSDGRRAVRAQASEDMSTILLHMLGLDTLPVGAVASAEERATQIEISLVLDVSSSMNDFDRMENMQRAATEFVGLVMPDTVDEDDENIVTMSLVPYSTSVNLGEELFDLWGVPREHGYSSCTQFSDDEFDATALPIGAPGPQQDHFIDYDSWDENGTSYLPGTPRRISRAVCPRDDADIRLIPFATDPEQLVDAIAALTARGGTGIDIAMRWGIAMLDPSARPVANALIAGGRVDDVASGRPFDHDEPDVIKIAVLMTDGDPDGERELDPPVSSGLSNVYYDRPSGRYSVLLRGRHLRDFPYGDEDARNETANCAGIWGAITTLVRADGIIRVASGNQDDLCAPRWYWIKDDDGRIEREWIGSHRGEFKDHPYTRHRGTENQNEWSLFAPDVRDPDEAPSGANELIRLTHREVFDRFTGPDFAKFVYQHPRWQGWVSYPEWRVYEVPHRRLRWQRSVARLEVLCEAAKAQDILMFTVGFELDDLDTQAKRDRARGLMRACATSDQHYFDVDGLEISEAFAAIGRQVSQLRLTR